MWQERRTTAGRQRQQGTHDVMTHAADSIQICAGLLLLWVAVIRLLSAHKIINKTVKIEAFDLYFILL